MLSSQSETDPTWAHEVVRIWLRLDALSRENSTQSVLAHVPFFLFISSEVMDVHVLNLLQNKRNLDMHGQHYLIFLSNLSMNKVNVSYNLI